MITASSTGYVAAAAASSAAAHASIASLPR